MARHYRGVAIDFEACMGANVVTVAARVSSSSIAVAKNGYLYRPGADYPMPLGTESFDHWFRHHKRFRILIPDGSGRWVGAKRDKGLIVLQKRVNKRLFQASCGRSYSLRFLPPEYLENRSLDLAEKITAALGEWGNKFKIPDQTKPDGPVKAPKLFEGKPNKRLQAEWARTINEAEIEYLILDCGQGYLFTAEAFFDFFEGQFSLDQIKAAIRRQRAVGNIIRRNDGYLCVSQ